MARKHDVSLDMSLLAPFELLSSGPSSILVDETLLALDSSFDMALSSTVLRENADSGAIKMRQIMLIPS